MFGRAVPGREGVGRGGAVDCVGASGVEGEGGYVEGEWGEGGGGRGRGQPEVDMEEAGRGESGIGHIAAH